MIKKSAQKPPRKPKKARAEKTERPQWVRNPAQELVMDYHVYQFSPTEKLLYALLAFVAGGICGLIFYGGLFQKDGQPTTLTLVANIVVFAAVGIAAIRIFLPLRASQLQQKRRMELRSQFRSLLESLASSMAVNTVEESFRAAYQDMVVQYTEDAYISREMKEIVAAGKNDISLEVMLEDLARRSDCEDIQDFSNVFSACRRRGGRMGQIVRETHDIIGEKMEIEDEITSKMSSNQLELNLITAAPVLIVLLLRATNGTFAKNFATPAGVLANTVALALFVWAYQYGRKIVTNAK